MKQSSLVLAVVAVALSNGFALGHAWLNRIGRPDAAITLTEKELYGWNSRPDESGLDLTLAWNGWDPESESAGWASRHNMERLGFDYSKASDDPDAADFYRRQQPRRAFVALAITPNRSADSRLPALHAVDVALDAAALRARHPDITNTIIVPGVIRIELRPQRESRPDLPGNDARIVGRITELPVRIHVPQPFSRQLQTRLQANRNVPFRLHLNYGAMHEPWVTGVDFPPAR